MFDIEHPDITKICSTGYASPYKEYKCPVCEQECDWIYTDTLRNPVGCDRCIRREPVEEYMGDI